MDTCPEDATFTRLMDGTLPSTELQRLEAHCDSCPACGRTLAELARAVTPDADGELVGNRYRLREPIGSGGMGVVFAAFDTQLQRKVAVKRLRETGTGTTVERRRARFLREAQLLASLSHPNVLTVHDVGGIEGELYVVTELVDGLPMSRWIAEASPRLGWRARVDLYLQAGHGLSAAHRVGVVHRDVKPENILVARTGRVLIGDFGLAGLVDGPLTPEATAPFALLTQTGSVLGTPAYMAPEQHDGKPGDALSDQFSFCVSLYESLHGRRPFPGRTGSEIAAAVRTQRPVPGGDGVPRVIDRVLLTGLAVAPGERHRSMDDLLRALALARQRPGLGPLRTAAVTAVLVAAGVTAAIVRHHAPAGATPLAVHAPIPPAFARPAEPAPPPAAPPPARVAEPAAANTRPPPRREGRLDDAVAAARARQWARQHPETDPQLLLDLADRAHDDRDGAGCLLALHQIPANAWPVPLAERVLRRRGSCEMLRGKCERGRHLLEPLDGAETARAVTLANCPIASLTSVDDRLAAVTTQADEARYAGNRPARRKDLRLALLRQTEVPELQPCLLDARAGRNCRKRLTALARAYQVLSESFLSAGECREGAELDVMQSQVRFQSLQPDGGDPALRCRAERIFRAYPACAAAGEAAERRCLAR